MPALRRRAGEPPFTMSLKPIERLAVAALLLVAASACSPETPMNENPAFPEDAPRVVVETNLGSFVIGLYEEQAPVTVANFLSYVDAQHFDGTVFHRVMPGFMVQGGGFVRSNEQFVRNEVDPPIVLESDTGLKNYRGAVSMARTGQPDSASDQFFVNLSHNQFLDRLGDVELGYAVFGQVIEGMDVIDAIAAVETHVPDPGSVVGAPQFSEPTVPVEDVVILSLRRQR